MVLAGILKKLEGHVLIRVKPPPSNRLWVTFEFPPKMEMTIEPIVSSRQITYGMILRTIENRIREVVAETLVLPNWDDMPFFDTIAQPLRGGIWEDASKAPVTPDAAHDPPLDDTVVDDGSKHGEEPTVSQLVRKDEKTMSMPNLGDVDTPSLKPRKTARSVMSVSAASDSATTSGVEVRAAPVKPKSMRYQGHLFAVSANFSRGISCWVSSSAYRPAHRSIDSYRVEANASEQGCRGRGAGRKERARAVVWQN
ncbi:hypothetical protein MPH_11056 [Macrophomina phaseolina MS6]|uniref:SMP-LTD domain-containing protein n=1 Tax=Macrophomina phaseolina (strain MS6) TaxID=1126212 RepID=K2RAP7_MACPH|nr:hypothetical protein MPH_11056 [Macrophomina phaseolina MS6]